MNEFRYGWRITKAINCYELCYVHLHTGIQGERGEPGATGAAGAPGGPVILDNECEVNNGGCHDICVDTYDGYCCMCRAGYHLVPLENFNCEGDGHICKSNRF